MWSPLVLSNLAVLFLNWIKHNRVTSIDHSCLFSYARPSSLKLQVQFNIVRPWPQCPILDQKFPCGRRPLWKKWKKSALILPIFLFLPTSWCLYPRSTPPPSFPNAEWTNCTYMSAYAHPMSVYTNVYAGIHITFLMYASVHTWCSQHLSKCAHTLHKNSHVLIQARLCNGAEASCHGKHCELILSLAWVVDCFYPLSGWSLATSDAGCLRLLNLRSYLVFLSWMANSSLTHVESKRLSRTVACLPMMVDLQPVGKNSSRCLWADMHPRANKTQQSSLPN